jgi:hypothetical protein
LPKIPDSFSPPVSTWVPAGLDHLAPAPDFDHLLDQPRFAFKLAPVICPRGVDDFAFVVYRNDRFGSGADASLL